MAPLKATTSKGTNLGNSESALGLSRAARAGTAKRACFSRAYVTMHASAKAFGGTASPVCRQKLTFSGICCGRCLTATYKPVQHAFSLPGRYGILMYA